MANAEDAYEFAPLYRRPPRSPYDDPRGGGGYGGGYGRAGLSGPADSITSLLMEQGRQQAASAERSGAMWGDAINRIGEIATGAIEQKREAKRDKAWLGYLSEGSWKEDPAGLYSKAKEVWGPKADDHIKGVAAFMQLQHKGDQMTPEQRQQRLVDMGWALKDQGDDAWAAQWPAIQPLIDKEYPGLVDRNYDPAYRARLTPLIEQAHSRLYPKKLIQRDPTKDLVDTATGEVVSTGVAPPEKKYQLTVPGIGGKPTSVVVPESRLEAPGGVQTYEKPHPPASGGGGGGGAQADLIKSTMDGIMNGTIDPSAPGRNAGINLAINAEAVKRGYDLAAARLDWKAAEKHIAAMNSSQQLRMAQAVSTAHDSLNVVDELAKQWKGGVSPILNRAQLLAAEQGAMGPEAQALAAKFKAQIADLTTELGYAYMGGNSPTDQAIKLAAHNLNTDWSEDTLLSVTELLRRNLEIRRNSMRSVGVAGRGERNPYIGGGTGGGGEGGSGGGGPKKPPTVHNDAEYDALPSGTVFIAPNGRRKKKP